MNKSPPRALILQTLFLTIFNCDSHCGTQFQYRNRKVTVTMTPTENYENNDNYYKSDAPCRKIPTFLLLRRSRGMRHTGKVGIALTGCVAHRSKQGKNIYFSRREPPGRLALR